MAALLVWFDFCLWPAMGNSICNHGIGGPESLEGISILIKGYIPDLPKQNEKLSRFDFIVTDGPEQLPKKIKLSWYFPDHSIKAAQQ
jgi:competence protein ComEC